MRRIGKEDAIVQIVGSTFKAGDTIYTHNHCLQVYSKHCDDYDIEPDKNIHLKTAEEIFTECHIIYNDNN